MSDEGQTSYDFVVVGSGFGGSVAALRLTEKGYRVLVLEAGRRFADHEFPRSNWHLSRFLFAPLLGWRGLMRLDFFRGLMVMSGAGVGGGSLVYANTLIEPSANAFQGATWPTKVGVDAWDKELAPHYKTARHMLGVTAAPTHFAADQALKGAAESLGFGHTFRPVDVGVYFGRPGETTKDPFFGGEGPDRAGCTLCGGCMVGCRHNAKNTLVKNYLYLAEKKGAVVRPNQQVIGLRPAGDGYILQLKRPGLRSGPIQEIAAPRVVLAAGVLGTLRLLLKARDEAGTLPRLSPALGREVRTNSESILGVRMTDSKVDYSHGVAIAASVNPDHVTKVEAVRYPRHSDAMGLLSAPLVEGKTFVSRLVQIMTSFLRGPLVFARRLWPARFATETIILLVMQSIDNQLAMHWRRAFGRGRMVADFGPAGRPPVLLPQGTELARQLAQQLGGEAGGSILDILGMSVTAHVLGGCPMGAEPEAAVIGGDHQVHGYPGLFVVGGASVPANLGVNPSLTITAMAERAMQFIAAKGSQDVDVSTDQAA